MKNKYLWAFLIVLASLVIHFYLMNTHYNFVYGGEGAKSICSINEKLNCESVSISPYAYLLGLPVAAWGVAFHLIFVLMFVMSFGNPEKKTSLARWIKTMALLSFVGSVVMGSISFFMMKTYCVFCISLYVLSIVNFFVLWSDSDRPRFVTLPDFKWYPVVIAFFAIPVVAYLADDAAALSLKQKTASYQMDSLSGWDTAPTEKLINPILTQGVLPTESRFTISEFADFQCIHCKDSVDSLHSFVSSKPDVRFEFYAFPIDGSCHPTWQKKQSGPGKSCLLARAAFCAQKQNQGWAAHQWMFDRFGSEDNSHFEKMIADLKLNEKDFQSCISSDEAFKAIEDNATLGDKAKVEGTPAIFVNGKKLDIGNQIFVLEALYKKIHSN